MKVTKSSSEFGRWALISGIAYLLLSGIWIFLMIKTAPEGTVDQQLIQLSKGITLYRLSFLSASLASFPLAALMMLLALFRDPDGSPSFSAFLGVLLLAPCIGSMTAAYVSQYTVFPRLLADMSIVGRSQVKAWYYNNPDSIPYFLALLGHAFFSLSALAIGSALLARTRIERAIGWLLLVSGTTGLIGFAGYVVNVLAVEAALVLSGFLTLPVAVLAVVRGAGLSGKR
jgi:hypothetical protein